MTDAQDARDRLAALLPKPTQDGWPDGVVVRAFESTETEPPVVLAYFPPAQATALADRIEKGDAAIEALARVIAFLEAHCDDDGNQTRVLPTDVAMLLPSPTGTDAVEATKQRTLIDQHWSGPLVRPPTGTDAGHERGDLDA